MSGAEFTSALIPPALSGVSYLSMDAASLLRRNLLI